MEHYYVSCKNYTANENSSARKNKENRLMLLSNCSVLVNKKSAFIKNKKTPQFR